MTSESINSLLDSFSNSFDYLFSVARSFIDKLLSYPLTYLAVFLLVVVPAIGYIVIWLHSEVSDYKMNTASIPRSVYSKNLDKRIQVRSIRSSEFPIDPHKLLHRSIRAYSRSVKYKEASQRADEYFKKYPTEKYYSFKGFKFFNEQYLPKQYKQYRKSSNSTERYNNRSLDIPYDED